MNEPVTSSTPDMPGMQEALATLQPDKVAKPNLLNEIIGAMISELPINPLALPQLAVNAFKNISVLPTTPLALVTAMPLVEKMRIDRVFADMSVVPEGRDLVDMVCHTNATVRLNSNIAAEGGQHGFMNMQSSEKGFRQEPGTIAVTSYNGQGKLTWMMIHELHHRKQLLGGVISPLSEKIPSPVEMMWHNRAMEADAQATAIDISFKMKEAGKPAAWNALVNGSFAPHAAAAYAAAAEKDPAAVHDGRAKREAFDKWFEKDPSSGKDLSKVYNHQGLSNWAGAAQMMFMAKDGKPMAPLEVSDIKKIGALSEVNYLDLPDAKPLDSPFYRNAHWSPFQAAQLASFQKQYEAVKTQRSDPGSKFALGGVNQDKKPAIPIPSANQSPPRPSSLKL